MNLHLLIHGNTPEEIKQNLDNAYQEFKRLYSIMGNDANVTAYDEFEFDIVKEKSLAEIRRGVDVEE